jgi:Leucine rich repeat
MLVYQRILAVVFVLVARLPFLSCDVGYKDYQLDSDEAVYSNDFNSMYMGGSHDEIARYKAANVALKSNIEKLARQLATVRSNTLTSCMTKSRSFLSYSESKSESNSELDSELDSDLELALDSEQASVPESQWDVVDGRPYMPARAADRSGRVFVSHGDRYEPFDRSSPLNQETYQAHKETSFTLSSTLPAVPAAELAALKDFYQATSGSSWKWNGNGSVWNFSSPNPCSGKWQGIVCTCTDSYIDPTYAAYYYGSPPGTPSSQASCNIERIALIGFNLAGMLPASMGNFSRLGYLHLNRNPLLVGTLPKAIDRLTSLVLLSISHTGLTGSIPTSLQSLVKLKHFDLSDNSLSHSIPSCISALTSLTSLYFDINNLVGPIPSSLSTLTKLKNLFLQTNYFSKTIPRQLSSLHKLEYLILRDNSLTDSIPTELGPSLTRLFALDLSNNSLSNTLPLSLSALTSVTALDLDSNNFNGSLPSFLGTLTSMQYLLLGHNAFTGTFPQFVSKMKSLLDLNIAGNSFYGQIPTSICSLPFLEVLNIGSQSRACYPSCISYAMSATDLLGKMPLCAGLSTQPCTTS